MARASFASGDRRSTSRARSRSASADRGPARKQSRATKILNVDEFGIRELDARGATPTDATATVIERFLVSRGTKRVAVPSYFPLGLADALRGKGLVLEIAEGLDRRRRA